MRGDTLHHSEEDVRPALSRCWFYFLYENLSCESMEKGVSCERGYTVRVKMGNVYVLKPKWIMNSYLLMKQKKTNTVKL